MYAIFLSTFLFNQFKNGLPEESSKEADASGKKQEQEAPKAEEKPSLNDTTTTATANVTNTTDASSSAKNATQPKNVTTSIRLDLKFSSIDHDLVVKSKDQVNASRSKLEAIREKERETKKRAAAINSLEAFIFDTRDKIETNDEFAKCSTPEERENIKTKLQDADIWLSDIDLTVPTKVSMISS